MCCVLFRRDEDGIAVMQDRDANGIALVQQQSRQASCRLFGELKLTRCRQTKLHRSAGVDRQHRVQIGFFLELSNEVAIVPRVNLPIDLTYLVAGAY